MKARETFRKRQTGASSLSLHESKQDPSIRTTASEPSEKIEKHLKLHWAFQFSGNRHHVNYWTNKVKITAEDLIHLLVLWSLDKHGRCVLGSQRSPFSSLPPFEMGFSV